MEAGGERSDIYIQGIGDAKFKWYRVQFLTADLVKKRCGGPAEMTPKKIGAVATLRKSTHGSAGSWDVIGDDIYWVGGFKYDGRGITLCNELLRHKVNDAAADPSSWEVVSSSIRLPSKSRFLAAVGTKKLCVVGGEDYRGHLPCPSDDDDDSWRHCGEIYDLEEDTWTYLPADYKLFSDYDTSKEVAVVDDVGGDQEPTRIVFYSCRTGSTLFLDVPSGQVDGPVTRANFNSWQDPSNEPGPDIRSLLFVTDFVRPVFTNNTFYWLTPQLHLLGYDIVDQAWLLSPSLEGILPSLFDRPYPILVGLQKGKLLAVISPALGELTVASLTVTRPANFLSVSVDLVQRLFLDDDSFMPFNGKAIHGAYHLAGEQFSLQSLSQAIPLDNRLSSKAPELHAEIHKQGVIQQAMGPGPSTSTSTKNLTTWGVALFELSKHYPVDVSKKLISDSISKLEEALEVDPQNHDAIWYLGKAHTSNAFLTPDEDEAKVYFGKAARCFQVAVNADPANDLYRKSLEDSFMAPELHAKIQGAIQQAMGPGPSTSTSTKGSKKKKKSRDVKYDMFGLLILAVGIVTLVGFVKSHVPPPPPQIRPQ